MYYEPNPITAESMPPDTKEFVAVSQQTMNQIQGVTKPTEIHQVMNSKQDFLEWLLGAQIGNWKAMICVGWVGLAISLIGLLISINVYQSETQKLTREKEQLDNRLSGADFREREALAELGKLKEQFNKLVAKQIESDAPATQ